MVEAVTNGGACPGPKCVADVSDVAAARRVVVGVVDSGVDETHPDINYVGGTSWLGDEDQPGVDGFGHGECKDGFRVRAVLAEIGFWRRWQRLASVVGHVGGLRFEGCVWLAVLAVLAAVTCVFACCVSTLPVLAVSTARCCCCVPQQIRFCLTSNLHAILCLFPALCCAGTHVAGIVGAKNTGRGVVGVSPNIGIYSLKILDSTGNGVLSDAMRAIKWVITEGSAKGIKVINLSLAGHVDPSAGYYKVMVDLFCGVCKQASDAGEEK
jgi:subtilisin family serine protease